MSHGASGWEGLALFDAPGSLRDDLYVSILACVLQRHGYPAGTEPLPEDPDTWPAFVLDVPPAP